MSRFKNKLAFLTLLAILVAGCGAFGGSDDEQAATPTPIPTPVIPEQPTYTVQRGEVVNQLEFPARVSPVEEDALYFKSGGYVRQVFVDQEQEVEEGELLAELEMDDLLRQMAQAEVALDSVELRLEEARNALERQITQAEMNVTAAEARLTQAQNANTDAISEAELALQVAQEQLARLQERKADVEAEVLSANINLTKANDSLADARIEYQEALDRPWEREEVVDGYARALQQAEWNQQIAQARHNQAIAAREMYQHDLTIQGLAVEQAELKLEQLQRGIDPALSIEVQRAQQQRDWLEEGVDPVLINEVNQAELALERLQAQVAERQITSPVDGTVLNVSVVAGRQVEAFRSVIVVADPSEIEVTADLADSELQELSEGQEVLLSRSSNPNETWQGTIRQLPYPYGTGGSSREEIDVDTSIRISPLGDLSDLQMGDLLQAEIVLERQEETLWLPPAAVRNFQGRRFVIVQEGERQRRVDVRVGIEGDTRIEILEGLEEGQVVLGQ